MNQRNYRGAARDKGEKMFSILAGVCAAAALALGVASPASAQTGNLGSDSVLASSTTAEGVPTIEGCVRYFSYNQTQAQVDNCPGNGTASWAWAWSPYQAGKDWARVDLTFTDGTTDSLYTAAGKSDARNFNKDIASLVICESWNRWESCSARFYV